MKTALLALGVLCIMGSCSSEMKSSKGIVCDASMNTVSIVTDKNDTLSFSTMDANKEQVDGLLLNDTLEVFYAGEYLSLIHISEPTTGNAGFQIGSISAGSPIGR